MAIVDGEKLYAHAQIVSEGMEKIHRMFVVKGLEQYLVHTRMATFHCLN